MHDRASRHHGGRRRASRGSRIAAPLRGRRWEGAAALPTLGCAYWGRDASVADRDLASLPELGFPGSSFPSRPSHALRSRRYRRGDRRGERYGLATHIAPWGVGGIFGGGGSSSWPSPGDVDLVAVVYPRAAPRRLFWDEPQARWVCGS